MSPVSLSTLHIRIGATCHQRVLGQVHHNVFLVNVVRHYSLLQDHSSILVILKKTPGRSIFKNIWNSTTKDKSGTSSRCTWGDGPNVGTQWIHLESCCIYWPTWPKKFELIVGERRYRHNHSQIIQAEEPCIQKFPVGKQPALQTTDMNCHASTQQATVATRETSPLPSSPVLQDLEEAECRQHG